MSNSEIVKYTVKVWSYIHVAFLTSGSDFFHMKIHLKNLSVDNLTYFDLSVKYIERYHLKFIEKATFSVVIYQRACWPFGMFVFLNDKGYWILWLLFKTSLSVWHSKWENWQGPCTLLVWAIISATNLFNWLICCQLLVLLVLVCHLGGAVVILVLWHWCTVGVNCLSDEDECLGWPWCFVKWFESMSVHVRRAERPRLNRS